MWTSTARHGIPGTKTPNRPGVGHPSGSGFTPATTARFLIQAAIWGSSFTLIQVASRGLSPSLLVLSRLVLAAVLLWGLALLRGDRLVRGVGTWGRVFVAASLGNVVPYLALTYGEQRTSAGVAGVLIGATPLLTLAIATLALRDEHATRSTVLGSAIAFVGMLVVIGPGADPAGTLTSTLACVAAAASYAAGYVYVRRALAETGTGALGTAASQLVAAVVVQSAMTPLLGWQATRLTASVIVAVVLLGVLGTGYATVLYFRLITDLGAGRAAAVDYAVPIFAVATGVLVNGEHLRPGLVAGAALILLGISVGERRIRAPRRLIRAAGRACVLPGNTASTSVGGRP